MKRKFEYFHNHGDDEGNNSLTICFGDPNEPDNIIVGCEDTEEDAVEIVKRLNGILDQHASQYVQEFKEKLKERIDDQDMVLTRKESIREIINEL